MGYDGPVSFSSPLIFTPSLTLPPSIHTASEPFSGRPADLNDHLGDGSSQYPSDAVAVGGDQVGAVL